jgi:hypothetical protein
MDECITKLLTHATVQDKVYCIVTQAFLLIYAMHKAYKRRLILMNQGKKEESDRHHEHNRTTGMLLAVVVLFLITELPQGVLN